MPRQSRARLIATITLLRGLVTHYSVCGGLILGTPKRETRQLSVGAAIPQKTPQSFDAFQSTSSSPSRPFDKAAAASVEMQPSCPTSGPCLLKHLPSGRGTPGPEPERLVCTLRECGVETGPTSPLRARSFCKTLLLSRASASRVVQSPEAAITWEPRSLALYLHCETRLSTRQ